MIKLFLNFRTYMLLLPALLFGMATSHAQEAKLNEMYQAVRNANQVSFQFRSFERMDEGNRSVMKEKNLNVDMTHRPLKVEINMISPNKGTKVNYDATNKPAYAKVYINLGIGSVPKDFFIHGSTIMADTHHPITSTGFTPIVNLVRGAETKSKKEERFSQVFHDRGRTTLDGRSCYKIELQDDQYGFESYTAQKGESVNAIAQKKNLSAYKIMKLNPGVSKSYKSIEGQTIKVPTSYAKYVGLYIDVATNLPYMAEVHDDKGLFEKYYFMDVKL